MQIYTPFKKEKTLYFILGLINKIEAGSLTNEPRNWAVLDSGCSLTIAGKLWMDCFLESLSKDIIIKVIRKKGFKTLRFGVGEVKTSIEKVIWSCTLK